MALVGGGSAFKNMATLDVIGTALNSKASLICKIGGIRAYKC